MYTLVYLTIFFYSSYSLDYYNFIYYIIVQYTGLLFVLFTIVILDEQYQYFSTLYSCFLPPSRLIIIIDIYSLIFRYVYIYIIIFVKYIFSYVKLLRWDNYMCIIVPSMYLYRTLQSLYHQFNVISLVIYTFCLCIYVLCCYGYLGYFYTDEGVYMFRARESSRFVSWIIWPWWCSAHITFILKLY